MGAAAARTTISVSVSDSITEKFCSSHCLPSGDLSTFGFNIDSVTDFLFTASQGGCSLPVRICFAVIQYSLPSKSIEKIVREMVFAPIVDLTIKVRSRMTIVGVAV